MIKRTASEEPPAQRNTKRAKPLLLQRQELPIWTEASRIRQALRETHTLLLVGETGSGKSTQVPQFLLDEPWCRPSRVRFQNKQITVGGCIAVTEPRRVAAISLARRVAEEMGSPLGPSSPVGYSVRFDTSTSRSTRIKFLTEGMLLQEMLRDPYLLQYSAVILDEVHERSVSCDLLMGLLLVLQGEKAGRVIPLKIVTMSATAKTGELLRFFGAKDSDGISDFDGKGREDEASEFEGFSDDERTNGTDQSNISKKLSNNSMSSPNIIHIEGRQYPVKLTYAPQPVPDFIDAALPKIFQIHHREALPGDILVFLAGQDGIEALEKLLHQYARDLSNKELPKLLILPLFAALPQHLQQLVFQPTPPRTRKVILSTNIAETSVTVSGVRHVIDCGKSKIKQFRASLGLDSLLLKSVSKSAAIQRMGRAGREAPGQCHRLYTREEYEAFEENQTPEMLRCDLALVILYLKARGVDQVWEFPFLDKPRREAFEKAFLQLLQLKALDEKGNISEVGLKIARLPLSAPLGRVLVGAMEEEEDRDCLAAVIDIISCLSVENLFLSLTSEEAKEKAEIARASLYQREGDHLTLLATVRAYLAEESSDRKSWCEAHFVSHRAMRAVMDVRKQLRSYVAELSKTTRKISLAETSVSTSNNNSSERNIAILKAFLRGFSFNVARRVSTGYKTLLSNQTVAIHPSSVLFGKKVEAIMYNEHVFTQKSYARGVSAVQMDWVGEVLAPRTGTD